MIPNKIFIRVVFPEPLRPVIAIFSPFEILKLIVQYFAFTSFIFKNKF